MEKIMYAYDIVKERIYKDDENSLLSPRDIDEFIDGDYIVCVGYARLFSSLLSFLGVESKMILSDAENHARSLAYVKDGKYGIDGFFVFDPTFDRRESITDTDYIDNYNYFALPAMASNRDVLIEELQNINMSFEEFIHVLVSGDAHKTIQMRDTISELLRMMGIKETKGFFDDVKYDLLVKKLNEGISLDDFIGILYNTRRCEYCNGNAPSINKEGIKIAAFLREYNINCIEYDENDLLEELIIDSLNKRNKEHLKANSERLMFESLDRDVSIDKDIADMSLIRVLKRRLTSEEK